MFPGPDTELEHELRRKTKNDRANSERMGILVPDGVQAVKPSGRECQGIYTSSAR